MHIGRLQKRIVELEELPTPVADRAGNGGSRQIPGKSSDPRISRTEPKGGDRPIRETGTEDPDGDAEFGKSLRKMVDNPAGRALMNQGIKASTAMWYADLIEKFGLNKEESEYFLQLVAGPMSAQQEIGLKILNSESPEERMKIAEEIGTAQKEAHEAIKDFLNNEDDYAAYEQYEERLPERQQLEGLRAVMASAEAPLSPEQESEVIEAMYRARTTQVDPSDWGDAGEVEALANGNASEQFERHWERSSQRVTEEVGRILDGPQLEAFMSYQEQMKEMQLMGLRMAEKMFKDQDGTADPN